MYALLALAARRPDRGSKARQRSSVSHPAVGEMAKTTGAGPAVAVRQRQRWCIVGKEAPPLQVTRAAARARTALDADAMPRIPLLRNLSKRSAGDETPEHGNTGDRRDPEHQAIHAHVLSPVVAALQPLIGIDPSYLFFASLPGEGGPGAWNRSPTCTASLRPQYVEVPALGTQPRSRRRP